MSAVTPAHAPLSPSASLRWLTCPASVRLTADMPYSAGPAAAEGTLAHSVAEAVAHARLISGEVPSVPAGATAEMTEHAETYADYLTSLMAEAGPGARLLLEQVVDTGIEECWGTADAVVVGSDTLVVVDYKYGRGVRVDAERNTQLMLYGIGALAMLGDAARGLVEVSLAVYQPRMSHVDRWDTTPGVLRAWAERVRTAAAAALHDPDPAYGPSEDACRWCPAAGSCRARTEHVLEVDFGRQPPTLTDDELAEILHRVPGIEQWCQAVQAHARQRLYDDGAPVPGWKAIEVAGRSRVADVESALDALVEAGYAPDDVSRRVLVTLTDLRRMLPRERFEEIVGPHLDRSPPSVRVVPEDDKRPATTSVGTDFGAGA